MEGAESLAMTVCAHMTRVLGIDVDIDISSALQLKATFRGRMNKTGQQYLYC